MQRRILGQPRRDGHTVDDDVVAPAPASAEREMTILGELARPFPSRRQDLLDGRYEPVVVDLDVELDAVGGQVDVCHLAIIVVGLTSQALGLS